jgi:uncharacterized protein YjiS (DUF1127 family)
MSTIHAATKQQVYSPLEVYWNAFLEWRKRERLRTQLCQLTESELTDIGITRREIDYIAPSQQPQCRIVQQVGAMAALSSL